MTMLPLLTFLLLAPLIAVNGSANGCVPITGIAVAGRGLLIDDVLCRVNDADLAQLEEQATAPNASDPQGMMLVALAHYSRADFETFFGWLELNLSTHHAQADSPAVLETVHLIAFSHHFILSAESKTTAASWYQLCLDMDSSHKECLIEAGRLMGENGEEAISWQLTRKGLASYAESAAKDGIPSSLPCSVAIQSARSALNASRNANIFTVVLAFYLIEMAESPDVCDERTLDWISMFEEDEDNILQVSQLRSSYINFFGGTPDLKESCIPTSPATEEEILDLSLLEHFGPKSRPLCESWEVSPDLNVDDETGADLHGSGPAEEEEEEEEKEAREETDPLRIVDPEIHHEDFTPHTSRIQIELLLLLETHRLTGWW